LDNLVQLDRKCESLVPGGDCSIKGDLLLDLVPLELGYAVHLQQLEADLLLRIAGRNNQGQLELLVGVLFVPLEDKFEHLVEMLLLSFNAIIFLEVDLFVCD
jgi:hypothetical protein